VRGGSAAWGVGAGNAAAAAVRSTHGKGGTTHTTMPRLSLILKLRKAILFWPSCDDSALAVLADESATAGGGGEGVRKFRNSKYQGSP
jgi:hypothetical protein